MQINEALRDLFSESPKPLVISIDGPAGSGKSTLAGEIARAFAGTYSIEVIHLDELYNGWANALSDELFAKLAGLIKSQSANETADLAIFDWALNSYAGSRQVKPAELLIIEGVGSFNELLRDDLTTSIWLDIDQSIGLARVLERDGEEIRGEMIKWQQMESEYFARDLTRESAEFILSTQ
jgi:uridine kinase